MKILSQYDILNADKLDIIRFKGSEIGTFANSDAEMIVCNRATAREILEYDFPKLKLVQLNSVGFENIPLDKYAEKNIYVCNAGTTYSVCMAETVVFGILQVEKRLRKNPANRHFKITRRYNYIGELKGKKAVMLGAGNISVQVAKRLNAFDVNCYGYDPYCKEKSEFKEIIRTKESLKESLKTADYVVNTLPLVDNTVDFIDSELLGSMKSSVTFVSVARMATINKNDLYYSLKKKQIAYAVLDMFERFPNSLTNKFRRLKNALILPGVSAISKESKETLKELFFANAMKIAREERPLNVVNNME